jgi:hypothetical protein
VGILSSKLGAEVTVLTDLTPCLPLLMRNARNNESTPEIGAGTIVVQELDWNDDAAVDLLVASYGPFETIICSDLIVFGWSPDPFSALIRCLTRACTTNTTNYTNTKNNTNTSNTNTTTATTTTTVFFTFEQRGVFRLGDSSPDSVTPFLSRLEQAGFAVIPVPSADFAPHALSEDLLCYTLQQRRQH